MDDVHLGDNGEGGEKSGEGPDQTGREGSKDGTTVLMSTGTGFDTHRRKQRDPFPCLGSRSEGLPSSVSGDLRPVTHLRRGSPKVFCNTKIKTRFIYVLTRDSLGLHLLYV